MIIVTGGAGFIGSHLVRALNERGISDIAVVDHLGQGSKFLNLRGCTIADYFDKQEFLRAIESGGVSGKIDVIYHQGACSDTMEYDGSYMMENNFTYSKHLLHFALSHRVPFVYASSAAVYGDSRVFVEGPTHERPLNVYGYSKLAFDQHVRACIAAANSTVVGLRYFNVYGRNEGHKGRMASCCYQFANQLRHTGVIRMFEGSDGYGPGEQRRDFVAVSDVVKVNFFFGEGPLRRGIFNVGTGASRTFNDIASALLKTFAGGRAEYIPFPQGLREKYQSFTQADISRLRSAGYTLPFTSLEEGVVEATADAIVQATASAP
jgi:ADP-L-glycero-D-manno-heptose 6-epimerase